MKKNEEKLYNKVVYFIILLVISSTVRLFAGDGKIDIQDILYFTHFNGLDAKSLDFKKEIDFDSNSKIDHEDYILLMNSFGSDTVTELKRFNIKFDIYPPADSNHNIFLLKDHKFNSKEDLSENIISISAKSNSFDSSALPVAIQPFFFKDDDYWKMKWLLQKIKLSASNISFADKDKMVVISDNPRNILLYSNAFEFAGNTKNIKIDNLDEFLKTYSLAKDSKDYVIVGKLIIYNQEGDFNFSREYILKKTGGLIFDINNAKLSDLIDYFNKKIDASYTVAENIKNDSITLISKYEIPYRYFPQIFFSILQLYGYKINLDKIENASGLSLKNNNRSIIVFEYDYDIEDFETKVKKLEDNNTKFKALTEDRICLILSDMPVIKELALKWDEINKIFKMKNVVSYKAFIIKSGFLKINVQQIIRNDKIYNIPELSNISDIDSEVLLLPIDYNNSILAAHPEKLKNYISDIVKVIDQDSSQASFTNEMTIVYKLVYTSSKEVGEFLNKLYQKNDNVSIVSSELTNSIIIKTTNKKRLGEIKDTIAKLDVKPLQVLIKVLIAEVKLDDSNRYGFEWKFGDKYQQGGYEGALRKEDLALSTSLTGLKYSLLNTNKFDLFFNMLDDKSSVNVLSKPQIMTKNNTRARIVIGKEVPIVKLEDTSNDVNLNASNQSDNLKSIDLNSAQSVIIKHNLSNVAGIRTEYKDVGISLEVIPNISDDSTIMLDIKQSVSEIESLGLLSNPVIKKREAATTVIISNDNTVVIGGMIKSDKVTTTKKVPFFNKLPGVGKWLFTSETSKDERSELLIFITPSIAPNNVNEIPENDLQNMQLKIRN